MHLAVKMAGSLLLYSFIAVLLILLVLLPRETTAHREGTKDMIESRFSWGDYKQNIKNYWNDVKEKKTLGITLYEQPVESEMLFYGLKSAVILIPALLLGVLGGTAKGVFDYRHRSGPLKAAGKGSTWLLQAVPDFFFIMVIQVFLFFCMKHDIWKPDVYGDEEWYNVFLPIFYLSMYPAAVIARYTSEALEDESEMDYIRTARSKGAGEKKIIWKHAMRNCLPKLLQHFMPVAMTIVSAMFVVEYLSMYRGIGTRMVRALQFTGTIQIDEEMPIDSAAIIGFTLLLLALLLVIQWVQAIAASLTIPEEKENR